MGKIRKRRSWKDFTVEDFSKYYEENYAGMSRSEVAAVAPGYYQIIKINGLLDSAFPKFMRKDWASFTEEDFQRYYDENYRGMAKKEVRKEDPRFFDAVQSRGLQNRIIPKDSNRWKHWTLEDFKKHYRENYEGMNSNEVAGIDKPFVGAAYRKGFVKEVFPRSENKPHGYWKDEKNIKKELEEIIEEFGGRFPSNKEIKRRNSTLLVAINRELGGIRKVRSEYGAKNKRRVDNYWKDIENVKKELQPIIDELGRFPTNNEIKQRNTSLSAPIQKYHGGLAHLRQQLGYKVSWKKPNYWREIAHVKREIQEIIDELGRFPSYNEVEERSCSLVSAIRKYHGGFNKVKALYGQPAEKKPKGYWEDEDNLRSEVEQLIQELGHFPSRKEIQRKKGLLEAVNRYHGGITKFKVAFGYIDEELDILKQIVEEADE